MVEKFSDETLFKKKVLEGLKEERGETSFGAPIGCKRCDQTIHSDNMLKHDIEVHHDEEAKALHNMITQFVGTDDWKMSDFISDAEVNDPIMGLFRTFAQERKRGL